MRMARHHREIKSFLEKRGARSVRLVSGGKHPRLKFNYDGRDLQCVVALTPSDQRNHQNTLRALRELLGAPRQIEPERQRRRLDDMLPDAPLAETIAPIPVIADRAPASVNPETVDVSPSIAVPIKPPPLNITPLVPPAKAFRDHRMIAKLAICEKTRRMTLVFVENSVSAEQIPAICQRIACGLLTVAMLNVIDL